MLRVLSTRNLTEPQRALLPKQHYALEEFEALQVHLLSVAEDWDPETLLVFTSGNAVRACFPSGKAAHPYQALCVGKRTLKALQEAGVHVLESFVDAASLSEALIQKYTDNTILFFSGNRRLDTLPDRLCKAGISLEERMVYKTELVDRTFPNPFDAVLFFSPSGVRAFTQKNTMGKALAACIGATTAAEAQKYTERIIVAPEPSVEAVLQTLLIETESHL